MVGCVRSAPEVSPVSLGKSERAVSCRSANFAFDQQRALGDEGDEARCAALARVELLKSTDVEGAPHVVGEHVKQPNLAVFD